MTEQHHSRKRNVKGLQTHAKQKSAATRQRAEEALTQLIKERRPITFTLVAQTAGISTAWLYRDSDLKQRIIHLRAQQTPEVQVTIPSREQASSASKEAMIVALKIRIREQSEEIKELKKQLEVAYGALYH
jgi:hypothetical protein